MLRKCFSRIPAGDDPGLSFWRLDSQPEIAYRGSKEPSGIAPPHYRPAACIFETQVMGYQHIVELGAEGIDQDFAAARRVNAEPSEKGGIRWHHV